MTVGRTGCHFFHFLKKVTLALVFGIIYIYLYHYYLSRLMNTDLGFKEPASLTIRQVIIEINNITLERKLYYSNKKRNDSLETRADQAVCVR